MAEVAEMGEVDDVHSNEEGILLNGDVTKDVDMQDENVNKVHSDDVSNIKDISMDSLDTEMMETENSVAGNTDEDSQDSQTSQDVKSQGSQDSQEPMEEGDTNTNSSIPQNDEENTDNSNSSSQKNDDDSRSSTQGSTSSKAPDDPLANISNRDVSEDSRDAKDDKKSQDQDCSRDGSESKSSSVKNDLSENGIDERTASATSSIQDIHEIDDDDEKQFKEKSDETIELNSEDEVDPPRTNGATEVIDLVESPEKKPGERKEAITPRRSSRNLNKSKSYVESDKEDTPPPHPSLVKAGESEESDIEEVMPQDPLAVTDQVTVERIPSIKKIQPEPQSTIVVKDTKRLVEIASKSNQNTGPGGKKEPTLVIIDTNSILSGHGPIPVSKNTQSISTSNFTNVLPVAVPAQGMYPPNMRATITPIPVNSTQTSSKSSSSTIITPSTTPLLPTLTDDMFVVEAPSFIVPYVYEKPPVKAMKDLVADLKKQIQDSKKERKEKRLEKKKKEERKKSEAKEDDSEEKDTEKKDKEGADDSELSSSSESESESEKADSDPKKPYSYFESPLGKFFIEIGLNMVQEYVQSDLLKQQKRKREREQGSNPETNKTIASLIKNIEMSKENNEHFKMEIKKCEFCNFKTESMLAMAYHLETPHMKNFVYKCNFCSYEIRSPHDILFHMEAEHAVRGHLERAPAFHQCPSCPFEDNQKGKLSRHLVVCARKFKPERNLEPPADWEPPAKIPRMPKMRATGLNATVAAYQTLASKGSQQYQFLSKMQLQANASSALNRGRGRPALIGPNMKTQPVIRPQGMIFKQQSGGSVLVPTNYQLSGNQVFQVVGGSELGGRLGPVPGMAFVPSSAQASGAMQTGTGQSGKKPANTPSISITPLPRGTTATPAVSSKPGDTNSKNSFVICEICDGYIKDLEQLRNHMQWIHKIKIHPKMIYNRPPLNCQKCQFRFFTDQGLERHLLGSHGLVTSSMQDAANKSRDSGRCPVCGRVYQWKLLNHVARDHNMTLKPAHLSYKCTVCTATFGMYKQFENHVYSAHSVVAKRVMDKKSTSSGSPSTKTTDMKPLKINDEITIIPQPPKSTNGASKEGSPAPKINPGTSKNAANEMPCTSRTERLARRHATVSADCD
ncbi:zinc finger protein MEP-1 isoform X3 [Rhynchophorus ferrugineus]|uniref:zinc finger protein MEP-1 isoform X3 n=1 Tax=Rhynchophorus ferrugineus TaxID=354439 RepID=UPI003FCD8035